MSQPRVIIRRLADPLLKRKLIRTYYDRLRARYQPKIVWLDDGYEEDYTVMFPMLKRYNVSAVLAIVATWIGKKGYLNIDQLRTMIDAGWNVASHSFTHRNLLTLPLLETNWELRESKLWIQKHLGCQPIAFLPPYGLNQIRPEQRKLALQYFPSICEEPYHFHSRHWRQNKDGLNPYVMQCEHMMLEKILETIEEKSPFFKCETQELKLLPTPKMPIDYTLKIVSAYEATNIQKKAWEMLNGKAWSLPTDALVFFILHKNSIVGTEYALVRNGVGTLHSAIVLKEHRKQGFYRLMSLKGLEFLINNGVTVFELHTNVKILWHFWKSLGFRKVAKVASHACSGAW